MRKSRLVVASVIFTGLIQAQRTGVPVGTRVYRGQVYFPDGLTVSSALVTVSAYFPRVVTGCPYSADVATEGTAKNLETNPPEVSERDKIYRDSAGKTRTEVHLEPAAGESPDPLPTFIEIIDPVAGFRYVLEPRTQTAKRTIWKPARREDRWGPLTCAPVPQAPSASSIGSMIIEGIEAEGVRGTVSYPRRSKDDPRPYSVVLEYWLAPDLKLYLISKSSDERYGDTTVRVTSVSRAEPDAELFEVPASYAFTPTSVQQEP